LQSCFDEIHAKIKTNKIPVLGITGTLALENHHWLMN
jgi:hypothetical protein